MKDRKANERIKHQSMKKEIEQILSSWGIKADQIVQIYPSAWEVNGLYVMKVYHEKNQMERNIRILSVLSDCSIPVAEIVPTGSGELYVEHNGSCFFMSKKLQGDNRTDIRDPRRAKQMGHAIARLHCAFAECEKVMDFWDNSLLEEMKGWVRENLAADEWKSLQEDDYRKTTEQLELVYSGLPRQLIHRDVHFGNFLFRGEEFSGYIDFDLSQKNIRIFDICYFLTGLLAEETAVSFTKGEWIRMVAAVIEGYESINRLTVQEKEALSCVMECIEILFMAYFAGKKDIKCANDAKNVFFFIRECEGEIKKAAKIQLQTDCAVNTDML